MYVGVVPATSGRQFHTNVACKMMRSFCPKKRKLRPRKSLTHQLNVHTPCRKASQCGTSMHTRPTLETRVWADCRLVFVPVALCSATTRSTPEKPAPLHVKTTAAASRSPKPASPQVDLKLKVRCVDHDCQCARPLSRFILRLAQALRASEILKSSARGSPSSPGAASPYFGDSIKLAPPVAPHTTLQTPPQGAGVGLLSRR
jgi:hypothetical protein